MRLSGRAVEFAEVFDELLELFAFEFFVADGAEEGGERLHDAGVIGDVLGDLLARQGGEVKRVAFSSAPRSKYSAQDSRISMSRGAGVTERLSLLQLLGSTWRTAAQSRSVRRLRMRSSLILSPKFILRPFHAAVTDIGRYPTT